MLTRATSSLMGQSQLQGGVKAVVRRRHQLLESNMRGQVSQGWGQGLGSWS